MTPNEYQELDINASIERGLKICENNKIALQNRYQLMHASIVKSATFSDMPHNPTPDPNLAARKRIDAIMRETDCISNLINLFVKLAKNPATHNEGYFLFKHYVIGFGNEEIFDELGFRNNKRKRKEVKDNAYLLVAQATNSVIYKYSTKMTFTI